MPILFVHGVASRRSDPDYHTLVQEVRKNLRGYIAPVISPNPSSVLIRNVYWGDLGAKLAWDGASCPPSTVFTPVRHAGLDAPTAILASRNVEDVLNEGLIRLTGQVGNAGTRLAGNTRTTLHPLIINFIGDVFTYLSHRGTPEAPGQIPMKVLTALREARTDQIQRANEPLIVVSHSMGGQIIYDIVTTFLPRLPAFSDIRIDFWCACSSQVGLFEEMKLFLNSSPQYKAGKPVPFPNVAHLGAWWNVWDPNDFLSYTVHGIIAGVDDGSYDSGVSLAEAHHVVLKNFSFYAALAKKIRYARRSKTIP